MISPPFFAISPFKAKKERGGRASSERGGERRNWRMFYFRAGEKGRRPNETSTSKELQRRPPAAGCFYLPRSPKQRVSVYSRMKLMREKELWGEIESLLSISPPGGAFPPPFAGSGGPLGYPFSNEFPNSISLPQRAKIPFPLPPPSANLFVFGGLADSIFSPPPRFPSFFGRQEIYQLEPPRGKAM